MNPQKEEDCDCNHQPVWLTLALAILPALLPGLVDKLGEFIIRYFFGDDEEEEIDSKESDKP